MVAIRERLRSYVVDNLLLDPSDETFTDETDLKAAGILDSLAILRFITFVEDQFAIELTADDVEVDGFFSVANVEKIVQARRL